MSLVVNALSAFLTVVLVASYRGLAGWSRRVEEAGYRFASAFHDEMAFQDELNEVSPSDEDV